MTLFDLRRVVPEPPEDMLTWPDLDRRIRRRRRARRARAVVGAAAVTAAAIVAGIAINAGAPTPAPLGPVSRLDGRVVYGQDTTAVTKTNLFANTSLYSVDLTDGQPHRLTHEADGIDFAVASPDGRRIAYSQDTYGYGPAGHPTHVSGAYVHVANADGSADERIYSCPSSACEQLVWSPDSKRLLINGDHVFGPDGQVRRLCVGQCSVRSTTYDASWSPDGQRLAFQYWKDVPLDNGASGPAGVSTVQAIGVMNADGSHPRLITDQDCSATHVTACSSDTTPVWSPDGISIAFTRRPLSGLNPNSSLGGPVLLGPGRIDIVRPDGSASRQLVNCGVYCRIWSMSWAPTGRYLAYVTEDERGRYDVPPWSLTTVDTQTGERHSRPMAFLTDEETPDFVWAPSGTHIAVGARTGNGSRSTGIFVIRVEDGELGPLRMLVPTGLPPITWLSAGNS